MTNTVMGDIGFIQNDWDIDIVSMQENQSSNLSGNVIDVDMYARGEQGRGIVQTIIQYALSSSNTETPSLWLDTLPPAEQGKYLWIKTTFKYSDGPDEISYNVSYSAIDGINPTVDAAAGDHINVAGTPTVTSTTSGNNTTFTFDYLKGEKGDKGNPGTNGISPTITSTKTGKITTLTITDATGTTTTTILDGADGSGTGDMVKSTYDTNEDGVVDNAEKVNNHTVNTDVPANAIFTDTTYSAGNGLNLSNTTFSLANSTHSNTTSTATPSHGGTVTAIDNITVDNYGRVTAINTKTITLPVINNIHYGTTIPSSSTAGANGDIYILLDN